MKLNSISGVTCLVADVQKSATFYETLGFRIGKQDENHVTCYVNWFWVDLIINTDPNYQYEAQLPNRGSGQYLHIKVDKVDEFYEEVVAAGMQPDAKPEGSQKTTGRSFVLRDPDGYKLVFFEKK